ncbi:hypothetical protein QEN19_001853 [Hanseniaspora menglaensis]
MMSDDEFDDNVDASIGVVVNDGSVKDEVVAGNKRAHNEINQGSSKKTSKKENEDEEDEFDSESDDSDYELDETGESKNKKIKKTKTLPGNNISDFSRKDKTLQEILDFLDKQPPIIPDPIIDYYLKKNGLHLKDDKLKKLISVATTKFISDIAIDTYEYSRIRSATTVYNANNGQQKAKQLLMGQQQQKLLQQELSSSSSSTDQGSSKLNTEPVSSNTTKTPNTQQQHNDKDKIVLRMSDLSSALKEYGLNIEKPDFYR